MHPLSESAQHCLLQPHLFHIHSNMSMDVHLVDVKPREHLWVDAKGQLDVYLIFQVVTH